VPRYDAYYIEVRRRRWPIAAGAGLLVTVTAIGMPWLLGLFLGLIGGGAAYRAINRRGRW
jgi:hypothetical protein